MNIWNKKIRDLREDNDKKQEEIAKYLNITQRAYSQYELDQRKIPIEIILKLSEFYDVTTDYILKGGE